MQDTSSKTDALNVGGHVILATTHNPFISKIHKSANFKRTQISSNKEKNITSTF
jgi:hypothetical protein